MANILAIVSFKTLCAGPPGRAFCAYTKPMFTPLTCPVSSWPTSAKRAKGPLSSGYGFTRNDTSVSTYMGLYPNATRRSSRWNRAHHSRNGSARSSPCVKPYVARRGCPSRKLVHPHSTRHDADDPSANFGPRVCRISSHASLVLVTSR